MNLELSKLTSLATITFYLIYKHQKFLMPLHMTQGLTETTKNLIPVTKAPLAFNTRVLTFIKKAATNVN